MVEPERGAPKGASKGLGKARKGAFAPTVVTSTGSSALAEIVTPSAPF
jgi:hypothetical protein